MLHSFLIYICRHSTVHVFPASSAEDARTTQIRAPGEFVLTTVAASIKTSQPTILLPSVAVLLGMLTPFAEQVRNKFKTLHYFCRDAPGLGELMHAC